MTARGWRVRGPVFATLAAVALVAGGTLAGAAPVPRGPVSDGADASAARLSSGAAAGPAAGRTPARLATVRCPGGLASVPRVRLRCATLTVPLDRARPAAGSARLLVTRVLPPVRRSADPVVHLAGGPGGSAESYLPVLPTVFAGLAARTGREVVILDQRGTGRSTPLLDCGERAVDRACVAELRKRGVRLADFGVDASADDVADLVGALGARRAHVWGQSFGSGLGIVLAHRHPGVLASLTLEAVDRPRSAITAPTAFTGALRALDVECSRQKACVRRTGGSLARRAAATAAALASRPLATPAGPVNGDRFTVALETLLEVTRGATPAPDLVAAGVRRDAVVMGQLVQLAEGQPSPAGVVGSLMNASMNCSEAATTAAAVRRANKGVPAAFGVLVRRTVEQYATTCSRIGRGQDRDAQARPTARTPVLVVQGALDPNTGLAAARQIAREFPRATLVTVADSGHFPMVRGNPCTQDAFARFVLRPGLRPTAPCAARPPSLSAPLPTVAATRLGPAVVEDATGAFAVHAPVTWWATGSGAFLSADGATVVLGRTAGRPAAALTALLSALGLPADLPRTPTPGGWTAVRVQDPAAGLVTVAVRQAPDGVRTLLAVAPATVAEAMDATVVEPLLKRR